VAASCRSRRPTSALDLPLPTSCRSCCSADPMAGSICRSRPRGAQKVRNPQLNATGKLQHLLTLEDLPAEIIDRILDTAVPFVSIAERDVKKVPLLRGKT